MSFDENFTDTLVLYKRTVGVRVTNLAARVENEKRRGLRSEDTSISQQLVEE